MSAAGKAFIGEWAAYFKSYFDQRSMIARLRLLSRAAVYFLENDLNTSAAAISYFTTLALFPLLLLVLNLGSTVFGSQQVHSFLVDRILELFPGTRDFVYINIAAFTDVSPGLLITCFGVLLWAGSWVFRVIEKAFSRIWQTQCRSFLHGRLITVFVAISAGLTLMASSAVSSFVTLLRQSAERLPVTTPPEITALTGLFWQFMIGAASLVVTVTLFTIIYRLLPNTRVTLRESMPGAVLAGLLWEAAKYGFSWLLPYFHYDLVYGSIGAGIALLSWVYISSLIMLFGAQLSGLFYVRDHSRIEWDEAAKKSNN